MVSADITAHVWFYPTAHSRRHGLTPNNKFGCLFELEGDYFDCRLLLTEIGALSPGQHVEVPIKFLHFDLVRGRLAPGKKFFLRDRNIVAEGMVAQVLAIHASEGQCTRTTPDNA